MRGGVAKCSRWATAGVRDTDSNGLDGRGDVVLGRPSLDVRASGASDSLQSCAIAEGFLQDGDQSIYIAARKHKFRRNRRDKIPRRADLIARHYRASAAHRVVHHHGKRFVLRRKDHKIRRGIDRGKLRLIDKPKKANARSDAEGGGFGFEL